MSQGVAHVALPGDGPEVAPGAASPAAPGEALTVPSPRRGIDRIFFYPLVAIHLLAAALAPFTVTAAGLWAAVALHFFTGLGVAAGAHRLFSHGSYRPVPILREIIALAYVLSSQGPLRRWVRDHRIHHKFSDRPGDPHSPVVDGFFAAHIGWTWHRPPTPEEDLALYERYGGGYDAGFIGRFFATGRRLLALHLAVMALMYAAGALSDFGAGRALIARLSPTGASLVVWGVLVRTLVVWHLTFAVNSLCHRFGARRYETGDNSRNLWWLALLTNGDAWHHNHHHRPAAANAGFHRPWEIDVIFVLLVALGALGLVDDLKYWNARTGELEVWFRRPGPARAVPPPSTLLDFDGSKLVNALTLLWLACLVPLDPFGANLAFTIGLFGFMTVAIVNHLFPERLAPLTHVVKALYSFLLLVSIRADLRLAVPLLAMDLAPLAARRLAPLETAGALCRLACIGIGFHHLGWNAPLLVAYAGLSLVYFAERRARIRRGRRHDYGWFHHFEHLAIVAFLFAANADRLDVGATWIRIAVAPVIVFSLLTALGILVNRALANRPLPAWFDGRIERQFREKLGRNVRSTKLYNYFFKPFDHALTLRRVTWGEIEAIVDSLPIREQVDEVIGVLSGGGFVASYVARRSGIARVSYIRSSYWSHNGLLTIATKIAKHLLGYPVVTNLAVPEDLDVRGKVVLLVDDTVCTAATMDSIAAELSRRGARRVLRYALFCNAASHIEYAGVVSPAPLIWPWGWESD